MPPAGAKKRKTLFHAMVQVTRLEEWCVEAVSSEEARKLLLAGEGHRCQLGDRIHFDVEQMLD